MIEIKDLIICAEMRIILTEFSMKVASGRKTVISGPSGSGKSSVLKAVMGFIVPAGGEITIEGTPLDARSIWQIRRRMAYVPQELNMGDGTARDILMRPFEYKASADLQWDEGRARDLFSEFLLEAEILEQDVTSLSGGEKRLIALVSALLLGRPVIVLDEVTTGLDQKRKRAILEHLMQREDLTVLAASHDDALLQYASDVICLNPLWSGQQEKDAD